MMGRRALFTVLAMLCVLTTRALFADDVDDCFAKGTCAKLLDVDMNMNVHLDMDMNVGGFRSKGENITFLTPELCLPGASGMLKARPANATLHTERSCPLSKIDSKYRTFDGTCNNPFNLGASGKVLSRVLPAQYEDGKEVPRMFAKSGRPLPSPRLVSKVVHPDVRSATQFSVALMQFGQFIDHDMVSTPLPVEDTRRLIRCCSEDRTHIKPDADSECFPIMFHPEKNFVGNCMEFVRSMPVKDSFGRVKKPREHLNVVTSFVDASTVYGSSNERMKEVRSKEGKGYLLKLGPDDHMPDNGMDDCIKEKDGDICFLAGDERVNEHPGLTVMHLMFARLHNRVANLLQYLKPLKSEEDIFQKTRAILIGCMQKILYADWLPIVLGENTMLKKGLAVGEKFGRSKYNSLLDPTVPSSFGTAVFRFGHTLIPRSLPIGGKQMLLRDMFFKPFLVHHPGKVEEIAMALTSGIDPDSRSQMPDVFIVEEVTNHLFETEEGKGRGFDLMALNLQRARDHGLPGYNDFREYCGLRRIESFEDAALGMSQRALAAVYGHPDDIELFTGGMSEPLADGGLVGETFNCLMSEAFHKLKYGDRFFYETKDEKGSFTDAELAEIRKATLSHIMCQTTAIKHIQLNAFYIPSKSNPVVSCDWLVQQGLDLSVFVRDW